MPEHSDIPCSVENIIAFMIGQGREFYADILINFVFTEVPGMGTVGVSERNGTVHFLYDKKFLNSFYIEDAAKFFEHECIHLILGHLTRLRGAANRDLANIAEDICVHEHMDCPSKYVQKDGKEIFPAILSQFKDCGLIENDLAENHYKKLEKLKRRSIIVPTGCGFINKIESKKGQGEINSVIVSAIQDAANRGNLPATLKKFYTPQNTRFPWKSVIRNFFHGCKKSHLRHTWKRPSRRFGYEQKGILKDRIPDIIVVIDTSGSINKEQLSAFTGLLHDLHNFLKIKIRVIECDCEIGRMYEFSPATTWKLEEITGGGGTSFIPPFEAIKRDKISCSGVIYLTDLEGMFPKIPPTIPVLWVSCIKGCVAPFGKTVYIDV